MYFIMQQTLYTNVTSRQEEGTEKQLIAMQISSSKPPFWRGHL